MDCRLNRMTEMIVPLPTWHQMPRQESLDPTSHECILGGNGRLSNVTLPCPWRTCGGSWALPRPLFHTWRWGQSLSTCQCHTSLAV